MKLSQILIENVELDFTGLPEEFKERLITYQPHYQEWGIREFKKGKHAESILDAIKYYIEKVKDNRYKEILKKVTPEPKNILTLTLRQVEDAQQEFERTYARQSKREIKRQLLKGYTTTLVDKPGLKIIKVEKKDETDGAAKIAADLVGGAHWCVVDIDTANEYLEKAPLYFIYLGNDRYLYHLPTEQLMDVDNEAFQISKEIYDLLVPYVPDIGLFVKDQKSDAYKNVIMKNPEVAYNYARNSIKGRWPEAEPYIMKDPYAACGYAYHILKKMGYADRWPKAEPYIMKDPDNAYEYAHAVINGKWPEAEPTIMKDPETAYHYARYIRRCEWPEAEPYIMKDPKWAYNYAKYVLKCRWPEAEPYIMKNDQQAFGYACDIIKGRWPEAESIIMKSPGLAYEYARDVIKDRWPEAESTIIRNPSYAYEYARDVIKDRWPEAESTIIRNPWYAYQYALRVLKRRWPEAESGIMKSDELSEQYKEAFGLFRR